MSSRAFPALSRLGPDESRRSSTAILKLAAMAYAAALACCTTPSSTESAAAPLLHIVPGPYGFLLCVDCGDFQPTAKHVEAQAPANATPDNSDVPLALSISPNEQIVAMDAPASTVQPSSTTVFFSSGRARISPAEAAKLRSFLQTAPAGSRFFVTGYTDATGDPIANKRLAGRRAYAVRDVVAHSIDPRQVSILQAAACCSGASDATEAERARNRHATLEVAP